MDNHTTNEGAPSFVGALSDELWGDFDSVCKCSEETFARLRNLSRLLANLAVANSEHATALSKLSTSKKSRSKSTSASTSCDVDGLADAVQVHMNSLADMHKNLAVRIEEEIVVPLEQRVKSLTSRQESVAKKGREDKKTYDEEVIKLNKARHGYYKGCKQVDDSEKSKEKPRNNIMQKLQDKVRGDTDFLISERERLKNEYRDAVTRVNNAQRQWYCQDLRRCFDQLEAIDRERIELTKQTLDRLVTVFHDSPKIITAWAKSLEGVCASQGTTDTLGHYLVDSRTKDEGPVVFVFEEPSGEAPSRAVLHVRGIKRGSVVSCESAGLEDTYMEVSATTEVSGKALDGRGVRFTLKEGQRVKVTRHRGNSAAQKILDFHSAHRVFQFRSVKAGIASDLLREVPIADKPIFQFPLDAIVSRDQQRFSNLSDSTTVVNNVPVILQALVYRMFELSAEQTEGIFRVPGTSRSVEKNREFINLGADEAETDDPHVCASLFKLFLRELPDPLIPNDLYDQCLAVHSAPEAQQGQQALAVVEKLPPLHKALCMYVIAVLQRFAHHPDTVSQTRMDSSNLAMVFSACFFRATSQDGNDAMTAAVNAGREKTFVKALIDRSEKKLIPSFSDPLAVVMEYSLAVSDSVLVDALEDSTTQPSTSPTTLSPASDPVAPPRNRPVSPSVTTPAPSTASSSPSPSTASSPTSSSATSFTPTISRIPNHPPPPLPAHSGPAVSTQPPHANAQTPKAAIGVGGIATHTAQLFAVDVDVNAYISSKKGNATKDDDLFADD